MIWEIQNYINEKILNIKFHCIDRYMGGGEL